MYSARLLSSEVTVASHPIAVPFFSLWVEYTSASHPQVPPLFPAALYCSYNPVVQKPNKYGIHTYIPPNPLIADRAAAKLMIKVLYDEVHPKRHSM